MNSAAATVQPEDLAKEAGRLQWLSLYRAECHITTSRFYSNIHTLGGAGAAGLAAASGGTAFTGYPIVAGGLAIGAAAASALITSIRPDEAAQTHLRDAKEFNRLANDIDLFTRFDVRAKGDVVRGATTPQAEKRWLDALRPKGEVVRGAITAEAEKTWLDVLLEYKGRFEDIEGRSLSVPLRLTRKTGRFLREQDGWYAPPYNDFVEWQQARLGARPRNRLLRKLSLILNPEQNRAPKGSAR